MNRLSFLMLLFLPALTAYASQEPEVSKIDFETNAESAFQRASAEGKHVFIVFKATWCTPCRWMESTTFQDKSVVSELATNYVSVAADIDQPDGFVLFYDHQVQVLPTMIILNKDGLVLDRIEESLGREKLVSILHAHAIGLTPLPSVPKKTSISEQTDEVDLTSIPTEPKTKKHFETLSAPPATGFSVQVGVYTLYPNVLGKVLEISSISNQEAHVEESEIDDVTVYKLLSGHFATRAEAEAWRARLAEARIPGYIRDLQHS